MENGCLIQDETDIEAHPSFQHCSLLYVSSLVFSSFSLPTCERQLSFGLCVPRNLPQKSLPLENHCTFHFDHLLTRFLPISLGIFFHIHVLSLT